MTKWNSGILSYFLILALLSSRSHCKGTQNENFKLIQVINELSSGDGSWVFSPASIRTVLEELYLGSGGETKNQIGLSLGVNRNEDITEEQSQLSEAPGEGVIWRMANRILVKDAFPLSTPFKSQVASVFRSQIENNNFNNPEATANSINSWVSNNTDGLIKDIVSASDVGPSSNLIILNAVYFKGTWKFSFKEKLTKERCFYSQSKSCVKTKIMSQKNQFKYGIHQELKAKLVQIPYNDKRYSMVIVLPDQHEGLSQVMAKLHDANLMDFIKKMQYEHIDLLMPKFTTKFKSNLNDALIKFGINSIFEPSADFSLLTNSKGLYASNVFHEAHVTVSEKGTVAAASTGMIMTRTLDPTPPRYTTFHVDHPFLYMIVFNNTQVLFAGKYVK